MHYRCEATSLEGFVQQIAACYLPHGYTRFVTGVVPAEKDPHAIDEKLVAKYGVDLSRWQRARRKRAGWANLHYIRFGRFFVLLATEGKHCFFEEEAKNLRDAAVEPIKVGGYSIRVREGHSHVRIEEGEFQRLRAFLLELAVHRATGELSRLFWRVPWEPFAPVRSQLFGLLRAVNERRKAAGFEPVTASCIRRRRRLVRAFGREEDVSEEGKAA
jgi:hypothetical protein